MQCCSPLDMAYTHALLLSSSHFVDFINSWIYLSTTSANFITGQGNILRVHWKTLYMSLSLFLHQYPACLACKIWVIDNLFIEFIHSVILFKIKSWNLKLKKKPSVCGEEEWVTFFFDIYIASIIFYLLDV